MTPVGHSLTGLAIGYVVCPKDYSPRVKAVVLVVFVLLANAPDAPLPYWGHGRYDISRSVFTTTVVVSATVAMLSVFAGCRRWLSPALVIGGAIAWYSHLLLDTFYNHGQGLAVYWPFSEGRVTLPIPWFSTMSVRPLFCLHNAQVFAIEAVVYGAVLAVAVGIRKGVERRVGESVS